MLYNYAHATTLFTGGPSLPRRLDPKATWLFQVRFELNPSISRVGQLDTSLSLLEAGMLVTSVSLPKLTVENKTYNAYNRVNLVQSKIKYDPVTITFHDDHSNVVLDLWKDYYAYYYRDGDYGSGNSDALGEVYSYQHKYIPRQQTDWGYTLRTREDQGPSSLSSQFIKAIRIYSLSQGKFTEYILVNPMITSFQHGEHDVSEGQTLMKHTMTVNYETVLYYQGDASPITISGFGEPPHYAAYESYIKPAPSDVSFVATSDISDPDGKFSNANDNWQTLTPRKNNLLNKQQDPEVYTDPNPTDESRKLNIFAPKPYNAIPGISNSRGNQVGYKDNPPVLNDPITYRRNNESPSNAIFSNGADIARRQYPQAFGQIADLPKDNPNGTTTSRSSVPTATSTPRPMNKPPAGKEAILNNAIKTVIGNRGLL